MLHDYIIYPLMAIVFTFDFYVFRVGRAMVQMPKDKEYIKIRKNFRNKLAIAVLLTVNVIMMPAPYSYLGHKAELAYISIAVASVSFAVLFWGANIIRQLLSPIYTSEDLENIQNINVYLRSFQSEKNIKTLKLEALLCKYFGRLSRTYAIGAPNEIVTKIGADRIYATDKEWKDVINGLLPIANSIIIRVSETEGCKWEMQRCISTDYFDKVCFIVSNLEEYNIFTNSIPPEISKNGFDGIELHSDSILIFFDPIKCKWVGVSLKDKNSVKNAVDSFINAHPALETKTKCEAYKQSKTLTACKGTEIPAEYNIGRWQFFFSPIYYMQINKWPNHLCVPFTIAFLLMIIAWQLAQLPVSYLPAGGFEISLIFLICIPYTILHLFISNKISYVCGQWPNFLIFNKERLFVKTWYKAALVVNILIAIINGLLLWHDTNKHEEDLAIYYNESYGYSEDELQSTDTYNVTDEDETEPKYVEIATKNGKYSFEVLDYTRLLYEEVYNDDGSVTLYTYYNYPSITIIKENASDLKEYGITTPKEYLEAVYSNKELIDGESCKNGYRASYVEQEDDEPEIYYCISVIRKGGTFYQYIIYLSNENKDDREEEIKRIHETFTIKK